ncbi:glycosyltransferase family 4 protein [Longimicrobium terrae]|uniref:Glycosyltransferase involved in cell wall biosynthesis n=1 Tax=Longimicrobium terrae TaxID=1639882 RepID=A0A841GIW5_9BACT|nr:glycosyltransferase family 4 protein [Longimicrobium terrae]MBB4634509.1 glycosyltransferase involved in cell wall biosynthesis [Longimicrobium terrae]MBB6068601.1 glycosyltransferase involved in cell wall biosynthesis [Longimicrobium terrae]NNC27787.1 glycosyltransferase family 4 protein [Longimicrobium terrae]
MPRILVVSNSPTPYNDSLYQHLAARPGVELHVAYGARVESHRLWKLDENKAYGYEVLPGVTVRGSLHLNWGLLGLVTRFRPDVAVLTGSYTLPVVRLAAAVLRMRGIPWVYWGEELAHDDAAAAPRRWLRDRMRGMLRSARGVLAIGSRACTSYARVGIAPERIADFRYYADTGHFALSPDARQSARAEVRASAGVSPEACAVLYAGQMIGRKRVDTLLRALAEAPDVVALLAGEGPDRAALQALARELGVEDRVRFLGFVQPAELPRAFAAADGFVLPSEWEGWGVVVPEAMAAGLPVLASERVNAALDLVHHGESGWRFAVGDAAGLAAGLRALSASPGARDRMSAAARQAVRGEAPQVAAERLVRLLDAARAGRPLAGI